ncbi:MAG TPA: DNA-binding response regulator [Candidatus Gemmiger faecigallinarum]|nr:DNA-binding response regulator [Candidatus Gemmiger faecigallinarum]
MLCVWLIDAARGEAALLETLTRRTAAMLTSEPMDWLVLPAVQKLLARLETGARPDLACLDLALPDGLQAARRLRATGRELFLLVIAPPELSPMEYLRPDILAGGLLLRPFTRDQAAGVLRDALAACLDHQTGESDACFWIESRSGRESVRYTDILYFEALNKRVSLVTGVREYAVSDTLDHLEQTLPGEFVRCHRAFIVRRSRISRIQLSQNCLTLDTGETLPLSRTYKPRLKGILP